VSAIYLEISPKLFLNKGNFKQTTRLVHTWNFSKWSWDWQWVTLAAVSLL